MLQKLSKFLKNNIAAVVGIAAVIIACLLMLLPGQFADLRTQNVSYNKINGYEFLFNSFVRDGRQLTIVNGSIIEDTGSVLTAGVFIIILLSLTIISLALSKLSSSLILLGGLTEVATSVFFFAMEANAQKKMGLVLTPGIVVEKETYIGVVSWASYVIGAILLLAGAFVIYKSIKIMKEEVKKPQSSSGPSYNYLKK